MIRAILWAQLLSMKPRKGGADGGRVVFSLVTGLVFYGAFALIGLGLMLFFADTDQAPRLLPVLSVALLVITFYWQAIPMISASFGASIDLRKLMAYPIPRNKLFLVEILLPALTSLNMILIVAGIAAGLLRNPLPGIASAPFVISGAVAFVLMNVLLTSGIRSWMERVFRRSRFREVFFLLFIMIGLLPRLLMLGNVKTPGTLLRFAPSQIFWPWASVAHLMLWDQARASAVSVGFWLAFLLIFSRREFARTLTFDGATVIRTERGAPGDDKLSERIFRLPSRFLKDPLAAMVEKELRTLARISRFRMAYGMSCFFGVVMFAPALRRQNADSAFLQYALPVMAVYGLLMLGQISYWNSFGFDRSAAQGYFCWPIRFRDALIAKNLTVMALMVPQILLVSLVAHLFHVPSSAGKILETFAVAAIAALFWFSLGNIASVRMPRAMNPDKMNQMSNKLQALTILGAPVVLLPIVLAYWARAVFSNEFVFAGILALSAVLGVIFYGVGLDSAVESAYKNRESMLQALSGSDGPISIT
jgi:hypothetical protein